MLFLPNCISKAITCGFNKPGDAYIKLLTRPLLLPLLPLAAVAADHHSNANSKPGAAITIENI
jgi:hypothetical protein